MAIAKQLKSQKGRTSRARSATSSTLEQKAVASAPPPEIAAVDTSSPPSAESAATTESDRPAVEFGIIKARDETEITLWGDKKSLESFMRECGTDDEQFFHGLVEQLANASARGIHYLAEIGLEPRDMRQYPDEVGIKFMFAFVKRNKPANEIEATLLGQMAATHVAIMKHANRLAHSTSLAERDCAERTYNKLARTFAIQLDALQRYRSKSANKVVLSATSPGLRARGRRGTERVQHPLSPMHGRPQWTTSANRGASRSRYGGNDNGCPSPTQYGLNAFQPTMRREDAFG